MARQVKRREKNPYIIVFWEGESEEAYMKFLRKKFHAYANLTVHNQKGVFSAAKKSILSSKGRYYADRKEIDQVWFIFDTEQDLKGKWGEFKEIINRLKKLHKEMLVRLLMTKGCIEYYFLLHYEQCAPLIESKSDKEHVQNRLERSYIPGYKKGDPEKIELIGQNYLNAIENGRWSLKRIEGEIGSMEQSEERDFRLFMTNSTFTTVHEGVQFLIKRNRS